jgi:hypothetical protein
MDTEELYEQYKTDLKTCLRQMLGWSDARIAEEIAVIDEYVNSSDDRFRALSVGPLEEGPLYKLVHCILGEKISHLNLNSNELRPIGNQVFQALSKALIDRPTRWPTKTLSDREWAELRQKVTAILSEYDHKAPSNSASQPPPSE